MANYKPSPEVARLLDLCLVKVKAVPYEVTLRWLFYRIMGPEAFGKHKYKDFKTWTSKARKASWNGWAPNTLVDDTRKVHLRGGGYHDSLSWVESFLDHSCILEKFPTQKEIVVVAFEAAAMYRQFDYYAGPYYVPLIPFQGDAGIDHKWNAAKALEELAKHGKPLRVLYFGDYDTKGRRIPESAFADIKAWCNAKFEWTWVGLTERQVRDYNLPENPEKPGEYQWEALEDPDAARLITSVLDEHVDLDAIREVQRKEVDATEKFRELLKGAVDRFKETA